MKKIQRQSMQSKRGSCHPVLLLLVATVAIATSSGIVNADVLYDTTWMTDDGSYNTGIQNKISASHCNNPTLIDAQSAEDFQLTDVFSITSVTADFYSICASADDFPGDGVLVEFFEDINGTPGEVPAAASFATLGSNLTIKPFEEIHFGLNGLRFTVDLSSDNVNLGSGTWWVSIVPVHEVDDDGSAYHWVRMSELLVGHPLHVRDGGTDHGNGYPGAWGGTDDWAVADRVNNGAGDPGDIAMKIEGTLVGEPCPWDLDGTGIVNTSDLLALFASWGLCKACDADFDESGSVNTSDLLILFANWGPCPK